MTSLKWCSIDRADSLCARFLPKQAPASPVLVDAVVACPARKKSSAVTIPSWLCRRRVDAPFGTTALVVVARMRSRPSRGYDCGGLLHGRFTIRKWPIASTLSRLTPRAAAFLANKNLFAKIQLAWSVLHGVDSPFRTTAFNLRCSSPAMSAPSWHDRLSARF